VATAYQDGIARHFLRRQPSRSILNSECFGEDTVPDLGGGRFDNPAVRRSFLAASGAPTLGGARELNASLVRLEQDVVQRNQKILSVERGRDNGINRCPYSSRVGGATFLDRDDPGWLVRASGDRS
jgi:hypothetical protein